MKMIIIRAMSHLFMLQSTLPFLLRFKCLSSLSCRMNRGENLKLKGTVTITKQTRASLAFPRLTAKEKLLGQKHWMTTLPWIRCD